MILYFSGNMPQLADPKKEKAFKDRLHKNGRPYHRLVTIYYPEQCETVLGLLRLKRRKRIAETIEKTVTETNKTVAVAVLNDEAISDYASNEETTIPEQEIEILSTKNWKQSTLEI